MIFFAVTAVEERMDMFEFIFLIQAILNLDLTISEVEKYDLFERH